jgi:molecular chaperone GrpE
LSFANDPRHFSEASESEPGSENQSDAPAPNAGGPEEASARADIEKLAALEAEKEELRQTLIRRQADFENYRKRIDRERREERDRAVSLLAEALLPVLDNFERALAAHQDPAYEEYRRGFAMIHRQLADHLAGYGVVRMPDPTGQPFDPLQHHALERVETSDYPDGTVIGEVQAGYKFRDRILRPAQVRVAAAHHRHNAAPPKVN